MYIIKIGGGAAINLEGLIEDLQRDGAVWGESRGETRYYVAKSG